jgi:hypothetical protein
MSRKCVEGPKTNAYGDWGSLTVTVNALNACYGLWVVDSEWNAIERVVGS